jgi:adenylate kinase
MIHLILLGPPGAGKGTQASLLMKRYGLAKLSTGDMLRSAANSRTPTGDHLKQVMASGSLVEDPLMITLIRERITEADCAKGFILDGFPRTEAQAEALDTMLNAENRALHAVIELKVNDAALVERISGRYACAACGEGYHDHYKHPLVKDRCDECGGTAFTRREDDKAETVIKRLESYHSQTAPLLPYYQKKGVLRSVDGMADMKDVTSQITEIVQNFGAVG